MLGGLLLRSSPAVPDAGDAHSEHGDESEHEDEGHSDEDAEAEGDHGHDEGGADSDHEVGAAEKDEHEDEPEGAEHTETAEVELSETQILAAGISLALLSRKDKSAMSCLAKLHSTKTAQRKLCLVSQVSLKRSKSIWANR
ncbi:hypothetical protein [Stutzerimonas stutzeri]|uniref:hypothetical protein n=1 Tax=Stutzerimonas stutzeri TaxID=316 RepID=UPI001BCCE259|nr:hypothetical protein [Stutzerimonas stutzeri]